MTQHLVEPVDALVGRDRITWTLPASPTGRWYDPTFTELAPDDHRLDDVIAAIDAAVDGAELPQHQIVLVGFSQGACGVAEYVARRGGRWGGAAILSGARVGPRGTSVPIDGDLEGTPTLLAASEHDSWIPLDRLHATADALRDAGADVTVGLAAGGQHAIGRDACEWVADVVSTLAGPAP